MCKVYNFSDYSKKGQKIMSNRLDIIKDVDNIMEDILIQDYIDFYIELKEKDPELYDFLESHKSR